MTTHAARLKRLHGLLDSAACEALLIEYPTDLFYLTGLELSTGKLIVTKEDSLLIVDGRYIEKSGEQTLYPVALLREGLLKEWLTAQKIHHLGFDPAKTTYQVFLDLQRLAEELHRATYSLQVAPVGSLVQQLRLIKDPKEIVRLQEAAHLGYQGYEFVASLLREGVREEELALQLEFFWKKRGGSHLAFDPIIAFGANSSMPHYRAGTAILKENTVVLMDIGVVRAHYHSDMTRVLFWGSPPPLLATLYSIVEEAKNRALALCRPGTLIGELDQAARGFITLKGYGEAFPHSLGHGIGLETHEPPTIREKGAYHAMPLQPGMVITIEPGIYLPGVGGIRLEDMVVITRDGYRNLYD